MGACHASKLLRVLDPFRTGKNQLSFILLVSCTRNLNHMERFFSLGGSHKLAKARGLAMYCAVLMWVGGFHLKDLRPQGQKATLRAHS